MLINNINLNVSYHIHGRIPIYILATKKAYQAFRTKCCSIVPYLRVSLVDSKEIKILNLSTIGF